MNEPELEYLDYYLDNVPCKLLIDVGCHKAEFAAKLLDKGFWAIGFEPNASDPELKSCLDKYPSLEIQEVAASDKDGFQDMLIGSSAATNSLDERWVSAFPANFRSFNYRRVPTTRLDTFFNHRGIKDVGMLKIDAEGLDFKILTGLDSWVVKPKIIMFETHHKFIEDLEKSLILLYNAGYRGFQTFVHDGEGYQIYSLEPGDPLSGYLRKDEVFYANTIALLQGPWL